MSGGHATTTLVCAARRLVLSALALALPTLLAGCLAAPAGSSRTKAGQPNAATTAPTTAPSDALAASIAAQTAAFSHGLNFGAPAATQPGIPDITAATRTAADMHDAATQAGAGIGAVSGSRAVAAMGAMANTADAAMGSAPAVEQLLDLLRQRARSHPDQPSYALALQLFETAETGRTADPSIINQLAPADQKIVLELAGAVQALAATPFGASIADRAAPLIATVEQWKREGDLSLPRLLLASRVDSYGVYTPMSAKFPYGKTGLAIIYCEVANFSSQKTTDDGQTFYTTRLNQQDTLMTNDGLLVWRPNAEAVVDRSHNRRHDFYLVKKLTLPPTLAIGHYTLRMTVTDTESNKIATATLPLEIVGTTSAAAHATP